MITKKDYFIAAVVGVLTAVFIMPMSSVNVVAAAASQCPQFTYSLYYGRYDANTGGQVTLLQKYLAQDSSVYPEGLITGFFGLKTEQAVKRWQTKYGIVSSGSPSVTGYGIVGPKTRQKIFLECSRTTTVAPNPTPASAPVPIPTPMQSNSNTNVINNPNPTMSSALFPIPAILDIKNFSNFAVNDLIKNFWTGDVKTGHIIPTWTGLVGEQLPDSRGGIWQAATLFDVLYTNYLAQPSEPNAQSLYAEWNYLKSVFSDNDLITCGAQSAQNFASDDTGWNAAMFLQIYEITRDTRALNIAEGAVKCGFQRWSSQDFGGGLWYNDAGVPNYGKVKSLYQTALANDAFRVYQLTNDQEFLQFAQQSYNWMESKLLRNDGVYWMDYNASGPVGSERPNDIHLAGSVSYLAGNMGMDLLHARFYRLTGDDTYKQRIIRTTQALLKTFVDSQGVFLNDRDGWTNGHFVREWVQEVLPLLPSDLKQSAINALNRTAGSIYSNDRTNDGYYGGDWGGPVDITKSAWGKISTVPKQIMTSTTAVSFVTSAELAQSASSNTSFVTATLLGQTGEDIAGMLSEAPDGIKDVYIKLTGVSVPIIKVRITGQQGAWETPANGSDWIAAIRPQTDPSVVDIYFDFWKQNSSYAVNLTFADGTTQTVQALSLIPQVSATLLGQTGEDIIGMTSENPDGIKDVHIKLSGVTTPLSRVRITTQDGAAWEYPANGADWIAAIRPESDATIVDVYFDFWRQYSSYTLNLTFSDGRTTIIQTN